MEGLMFTVGVVSAACVLIGLARLGAWVLDRREEHKARVIRDAAFVAQARSEIADRDYAISMLDQQDVGEAA